ncbi:MAG TPA: DUF1015 domain-containing protein [Actinomycetota bacterium]|nr:DUF1015 domain-containing protein [Actinomycetota bacterium]
MPRITAFRALRYRPGSDLGLVSAPPYDVIAPDERDRLERLDPHNIIRITLGAERPGDDDQDNRYSRAASFFREWLNSGILVADPEPHLYLYRSDFTADGRPRSTAGVVAALELEELGQGGVFGHEKTRPGPKADRLALMRTTRANLEPLWFFASGAMDGFRELVEDLEQVEPVADVADPQGVRHRAWIVPEDQAAALEKVVSDTPLVVADGHHRYETALTYRNERRQTDGPGPWDSTLAIISDPVQFAPALSAIHRLVSSLSASQIPGLEPFSGSFGDLEQAVEEAGPGTIGVASAEGRWTVRSTGEVDTVWLAEQILEPAGADVTYEHDPRIVEQAVAGGALAFVMAPVPVHLVAAKALAGIRLPPKTTLFWPKPRTGLLMRDLEPDS